MNNRMFRPWVLLALAFSHPLFAADKEPKIALVLAGGGAKGAAHVGALKALEELRIPVDYITGTSMGAYIAGLYSTGMSADRVAEIVNSIDWSRGYRDRIDRSDRRVRNKEIEDRYQINADLGFSWDGIQAPKGVIQGQSMAKILRYSVGNVRKLSSFDQLPIPYRSVATDIVNLKPVVIDHGNLVDAMMASMSVPGVLPPYKLNNQLLVDGGVTNNMPVDVAKSMGAQAVIAIDISTDYRSQDDFKDLLSIADQLSNYLVRKSTQQQAAKLSGDDVYLKPDVGDMDTTDFDRMNEAYQKGYQIVMSHQSELAKWSLTKSQYQQYSKEKREKSQQVFDDLLWKIDEIKLENESHYSDQVLKSLLDIPLGEQIDVNAIENRIDTLYALDRFELITYRIRHQDEKNTLIVHVKEKSWGPNFADFRFALEEDFDTKSDYTLGGSFTFTDLDDRGSELRLDMDVGSDRRLFGELYVPLSDDQKFFTTASLTYQKKERYIPQDGYFNSNLDSTKEHYDADYIEFEGELALGFQHYLWDEFRVGARAAHGEARLYSPGADEYDYKRLGGFVSYRIDTLDSYALPNNGVYFYVDYLVSNDEVTSNRPDNEGGYTDTVYELSSSLKLAKSFGRHTVVGNLEYDEIHSKKSSVPIYPTTLGGFMHLSGVEHDSLIGENKAFASFVYRYRWFDNDFGLFTSPVYVGTSIEYGGVWTDSSVNLDNAPMYSAGSVFAGIDSPIGPIMLGYGRSEHDFTSVYFVVGNSF